MTALESKQALTLLGDDAEDTARWMVGRTSGVFESRRLHLLDTVPGVIEYYSEGSAALAVDAYMDARMGDFELASDRMAKLMRSEMTRPYRDTTLRNGSNDGMFAGYKRIARAASCGFCKALAARGAVFKQSTAYFAAHDNCQCTAAAAFVGQENGPEADVMQYMASKRRRTPAEKARINEWASQYA